MLPTRFLIRRFSTSGRICAGHSKWQNIKHRKARQDATRSTTNTKIANMIYVAAKEGGGSDPTKNVRLATLIENALKQSVPKKVIEGAVSRASRVGGHAGDNTQSVTYEGIGPGGAAFIVEALTENKNRTAQQIRAAFLKFKGSLSPTAFLFKRRGWIDLVDTADDFDTTFEKCLDFPGVEDVEPCGEGEVTLYTAPESLSICATAAREQYKISDMGLAYVPDPDQTVSLSDPETLTRLQKLRVDLENLDDVNNVYTNLDTDQDS